MRERLAGVGWWAARGEAALLFAVWIFGATFAPHASPADRVLFLYVSGMLLISGLAFVTVLLALLDLGSRRIVSVSISIFVCVMALLFVGFST
jgi:hypothetical protein